MISFTELADSEHSHFARDLFESAFPEDERPDFEVLGHRDSRFHFMVAATADDDEPVGILSFWDFEDFTYVEHFAIDEELRGQGLGKAVFLNFMSQRTGQVVLEAELPHDEVSEHRVEFYATMGFDCCPQRYEQPSYRKGGRKVPMVVMSKLPMDDDEFEEVRSVLEREVYGVGK